MKKFLCSLTLIMMLMYVFLPLGQIIYADSQLEDAPVAQNTQKTLTNVPEVATSDSLSSAQPSTESSTQQSQSISSDRKATNQSTAPTTQSKNDQPTKVSPNASPTITSLDETNTKVKEKPILLQAVKEPTPTITIDFVNEQLTGFDSAGRYEIEHGQLKESVSGSTTFSITDDMMSKYWKIKKLGNGTTTDDSEQQELLIPGRAQLPEDWIQAFDETVQGKNDGYLLGVNSEQEYRLLGEPSWLKGYGSGKIENLAPGTYEIRTANGYQFVSPIVQKTIKAGLPQHPIPTITIDYEEELLKGFDPNGNYKLWHFPTSKEVTGQTEIKLSEDMFGKGWEIVRIGEDGVVQDSEGQELLIDHRTIIPEQIIEAIPESAQGENDGQIKGVDSNMSYRKVGSNDWLLGPPDRVAKNLEPGEYEMCYLGSNVAKKFASKLVKRIVEAGLPREATPTITIDYEAEKLIGFDENSKYEVNFGSGKKEIANQTELKITEEMFGTGGTIVEKGDGTNTQNSKAQILTIPWRQTLLENHVTAIDESAKGENDGKLQGINLAREYRKKGDTNWIKGASNSTVENLAPGQYEIRYFGSNQTKKFASLIITKTINAGLPREATPAIKIDYEKEKLTGFLVDAKYKLFLGNTIIEIENQAEITIAEEMMSDQEWQIIRKAQDSTKLDSDPQLLTIPKRQAIPENSIKSVDESILGKKDGQLQGVLSTMEYRLIGTTEWIVGTDSGVIANLESGEYEIRYRGSNSLQTFHGTLLKKTIKQGKQELEKNYTVVFDSTGGSIVKNQQVKRGSPIIKPKNPTREGYKFDGWFTERELINAWDFTTTITEDIILYAKWEKNQEETIPTSPEGNNKNIYTGKQVTTASSTSSKSSTKKSIPKGISQNETNTKYPKTNDSTSTIHWVGTGLLIILGIILIEKRKLKNK